MSVDGKATVPGAEEILQGSARQATAPPSKTLEERLRDLLGIPPEEEPPTWLKPQKSVKLKPGWMAYELSMMDRNLAFGACQFFCQKKGEKKIENHQNLDRMRRLLNFEETLEFFATLGDVKDQRMREWNGQRMRYNRWRDWKAGLPVKVDASLEGDDGVKTIIEPFDPNAAPPKKPALKVPMLAKDLECGPIRTIHIPAKLVVWLEKALKAADWGTNQTEYIVALCAKFGIEPKEEKEEEEAELTEEEEAESE